MAVQLTATLDSTQIKNSEDSNHIWNGKLATEYMPCFLEMGLLNILTQCLPLPPK